LNLMPPLTVGAFTMELVPYTSQFATGFDANKVYRLGEKVPTTFPYQFPVELRVYVAWRFMKSPEEAGINEFVWMVVILAVATLRVVAVLAVIPDAA
jgi:hypothetical protein